MPPPEELSVESIAATPDVSSLDPLAAFAADLTSEPDTPAVVPEIPAKDEPAATDEPEIVEDETESHEEDDDFEGIPAKPPGDKPSAKASEDWKRLRTAAKEHKSAAEKAAKEKEEALKPLQEELAELRLRAAKLPEYEEKAKFVEEAERELAISRIESTREYKDSFLAPMNAIAKSAVELAKANEIDGDAVLDAISERDPASRRKRLKEVTAGLDDIDRTEILTMAADTQALLAKSDKMRENAVEASKEREELASKREKAEKERATIGKEFFITQTIMCM